MQCPMYTNKGNLVVLVPCIVQKRVRYNLKGKISGNLLKVPTHLDGQNNESSIKVTPLF